MAPTGIIGSVGQSGQDAESVNVVIENRERVYQTKNPKREVKIKDVGSQTEIEDMRGQKGTKHVLQSGQNMKIKSGLFDEEKIELDITHYNKES